MTPTNYTVDAYMLDWNQRRPWVSGLDGDQRNDREGFDEVLTAARSGRYEYSFTVQAEAYSAPEAAEYAWLRQGNNYDASKVRRDRQSMSMGDVVMIDGRAYVAAAAGFVLVPGLAELLSNRVEQSWDRWTDDSPKQPTLGPSTQVALARALARLEGIGSVEEAAEIRKQLDLDRY